MKSGREAKFYKLTRKGRKQLEAEAAGWRRVIEIVGLILGMAEGALNELVVSLMASNPDERAARKRAALPYRPTRK